MLFEVGAVSAGISAILLSYEGIKRMKKKTDLDVINEVFENLKIGIRKGSYMDENYKLPKFLNKKEYEWGWSYVFKLPKGISFKKLEPLIYPLQDALNKDVELEFDGVLHVRVSDYKLPKVVNYDDVLPVVKKWEIPIGLSPFDLVKHDFDKIPHMTIGGITRYGKTVLLKVINTTLTVNNPDDVKFHYFDLKGGLEFGAYENLKQTLSLSTDPIEALINLQKILDDMQKKMKYFRENLISNIVDTGIKERTFIIVDEGAQLAKDTSMTKKEKDLFGEIQLILSKIAEMGGAIGYRLIYATQYPTGDTLPRRVKQNADAKVAFRVSTNVASGVCIDEYGAEDLPHKLPGRAIYKTDKMTTIQVPFTKDFYEYVKRYEVIKNEIDISDQGGTRRKNIVEFRPTSLS